VGISRRLLRARRFSPDDAKLAQRDKRWVMRDEAEPIPHHSSLKRLNSDKYEIADVIMRA
jgi:hypothetical protein